MIAPMTEGVDWSALLEGVLAADLPHREALVRGAAQHCILLLAANPRVNLTRIVEPHELAVKHVLDSVLACDLLEGAGTVLDLGSGAGFPGIPLALVLPRVRFLLAESVGKKARILADFVRDLELPNVEVCPVRGEALLRERRVDWVVARAVASVRDFLRLLRPVRESFSDLLLYKGPEADREILQAGKDAGRMGLALALRRTHELPAGAGARHLLVYRRSIS